MGLDFLHITFQIEKAFRVKFALEDLVPLFLSRKPPDVTAGELHGFVRRELERRHRAPPVAAVIEQDQACAFCGYNLRGLGGAQTCPECGAESAGDATWSTVRKILGDALCVEPAQVRQDSLLRKDLGAA